MPLYEYECEDCGIRFERRQPMTAEPVKTCPECEGTVRRLIHPVGIIFKGKGFYVTDNRKAKSSTAVPKEKEESTTKASTKSQESGAASGSKATTQKSSGDANTAKSDSTGKSE